jgi:hypothetical protein
VTDISDRAHQPVHLGDGGAIEAVLVVAITEAHTQRGERFGALGAPIEEPHVTVVNAATGEIMRDLIIDPRRDYQPTGRPPGPATNNK